MDGSEPNSEGTVGFTNKGSPQTPPTSEQETLPTPLPSGDVYQEKTEFNRIAGLGVSYGSTQSNAPQSRQNLEDTEDTEEEEDDDDDDEIIPLDSSPSNRKSERKPSDILSSPIREQSHRETSQPTTSTLSKRFTPQNVPTNWRNPPPEPSSANEFFSLTLSDINSLPESSLRPALSRATQTIQDYHKTHRKYESLVAHYKLQNKLLTIETHEAAQRHEVETSIAKREVDRLRIEAMTQAQAQAQPQPQTETQGSQAQAQPQSQPQSTPLEPAPSAKSQAVVEAYRRKLRKTKTQLKDLSNLIEHRDNEIERLRHMLRDMTTKPEQVAPPSATSGPSSYYLKTPQQQPSSTPSSPSRTLQSPFTHIPQQQQQIRESSSASDDSGQGLSALEMLASQVLSQPRIQQSSSLRRQQQLHAPLSPASQHSQGLMSPLEFNESSASLHAPLPLSPEKRRRESSASTITIPSEEEEKEEGAEKQRGYNSGVETDIEEVVDDDDDEDDDGDGNGNGRRVAVATESVNKRANSGSPKKYIRKNTKESGNDNDNNEDNGSSSSKRLPIGRILDFGN